MILRQNLKVGDRVFVWSPEYKRTVAVTVTKVNANTFQGQDSKFEKYNKLPFDKAYTPDVYRDYFPEDYYKQHPKAAAPQPKNYSDLEAFKKVFDAWAAAEIWEQEQEKDGTGLKPISVAESVSDSPLPVSSSDSPSDYSAKSTPGAETFLISDIPKQRLNQTSETPSSPADGEAGEVSTSVPSVPHVSHSLSEEEDKASSMSETVSPQLSTPSEISTRSTSQLKMSPDFSIAPSNQETEPSTSTGYSNSFPAAGTFSNGSLYPAPTLEVPGVGSDSLLLGSPTALSSNGNGRPPGQTKLEYHLLKEGAIAHQEVANPEFLESGSGAPLGWTNPQEKRSGLELLQAMKATEPEEKPSAIVLIPESLASLSKESSISTVSPKIETINIGGLDKATLLHFAVNAHIAIAAIEKDEFALALSKLEQARAAGEFLAEFKRRCQHGEFDAALEQHGIGKSQAALYRRIAQNWEALIEKVRNSALLEDCQVSSLSWADKQMRSPKSALPANPDHYRTPNTPEQPILSLVEQVFAIDLDPCADKDRAVPAKNHYTEEDDGLALTWRGTVFMNPPFSDPLVWVDKLCCCYQDGDVIEAIALLKAGTVHNQGTGSLIARHASAICNWRGRIAFLNDDGVPVRGADFDCVLVYFGNGTNKFKQVFEPWGTVSFVNTQLTLVSEQPYSSVREETDAIQTQVEEMSGLEFGSGDRAMPEMEPNYDALEDRPQLIQSASIANEAALSSPDKTIRQTEWIIGFLSQIDDFSEAQIQEIWQHIADKLPIASIRNYLEDKGEILPHSRKDFKVGDRVIILTKRKGEHFLGKEGILGALGDTGCTVRVEGKSLHYLWYDEIKLSVLARR